MKRFASFVVFAAVSLLCAPLFASDGQVSPRARVARIRQAQDNTFSVQAPVVARVQGTAFFRTSIDINNNSASQTITVVFQYAYTCVASSCQSTGDPLNPLFHRTPKDDPLATFNLPPKENFHQDDFVDYLDKRNLLVDNNGLPVVGAAQGSIGTLLVTFKNVVPFESDGFFLTSEATVVARTYNHLDESDPASATVGFASNASNFFESSDTTLIGTAQDTKGHPTIAGKLRSNVGVLNTDINGSLFPPDADRHVSVVLTAYDGATGQLVGTINDFRLANIQPGELRQIVDLWNQAGISPDVHQVVVFVDNLSRTSTSPTFEGYVTILDGGAATSGPTAGIATQDAAFFELKCADPNGCAN